MSEFKSFADLLIALRNYKFKGILDPRLNKTHNGLSLKATANSELVDADGGYLVGGEIIAPLLHSISQKSMLFAKASKFYSNGPNVNTAYLPFVDETHRTSSAFQMKAYWIGEGSDKTKAKYTIGLSECKLQKVYCNMAITEELWSDSAMFRSAIDKFISSMEEGSLLWKIEAGMLYGDGSATNGMYGIFGPTTHGTIGVAEADPLDEATLNAFNDALAPATHKTSEWYMSEENYIELQAINFTNENDKYYKDGDLYVYGKKVNVVEQMVSPYDLLLGDVQLYAVALKTSEVESASTIHVLFNSNEREIRFGLRIAGISYGNAYDLDDGTSVASFVVPATSPAEESSSSSSVDSSSSSSSSNSSSSNSSSSSVDSSSSSSSTDVSNSSESSSSHSISSESSSSISTQSSESSSSHSISSESSSSISTQSSDSSDSSSSSLEGCSATYCGNGFTTSTFNELWTNAGQYAGKPAYTNASATVWLWYSTAYTRYVISADLGDPPNQWLSSQDDAGVCPDGVYAGEAGVMTIGACNESSSSSSSFSSESSESSENYSESSSSSSSVLG